MLIISVGIIQRYAEDTSIKSILRRAKLTKSKLYTVHTSSSLTLSNLQRESEECGCMDTWQQLDPEASGLLLGITPVRKKMAALRLRSWPLRRLKPEKIFMTNHL